MKITFILAGWSTSPIAVFKIIYEYANRLVERGHSVNLVHPLDQDNSHSILWRQYVKIRRTIGSRVKKKWFNLHPGVNLLVTPTLEERYIPDADVVIASDWPTAYRVNDYSSRKGEKFYFIQGYEAWLENRQAIDKTWKLRLKKIVVSQWLREIAEKFGEIAVCVPNAIDVNVYRIENPIEKRDPYSIGMLYHEASYKGFQDGFEAVSAAKSKFPQISLKLFGVFPKPKNMPAWVEYLRNPSLSELVGLYNSISIFVHSSISEGWGLPPAEAMACGCAIVATNSKGILDYAEHGKNAFISPIKSPARLAEHILYLFENNNTRILIAKTGNERIKQFTWEKSVLSFEKALIFMRGAAGLNKISGNYEDDNNIYTAGMVDITNRWF